MSPFVAANPREAGLPDGGPLGRATRAIERAFDRLLGESDNPLRQLGGLAFHLFWLVAITGAYLYIFYDTSVEGAHASVERLTYGQWWAGGVMRSLHRYASDALVVVVVAHIVRELALGRFRGFRWYTWITGVPTVWLIVALGGIGYWLVWDTVALFVATAITEWFGALPGFGPSLVRNFIDASAVSDRLFSLILFLHIGVSLVLLLVMWIHVRRLTRPRTNPSRGVALATLATLVVFSLLAPARSQPPADLVQLPATLPIDWFYLAPLPAMYASSPETIWIVMVALTLLLGAVPWFSRAPRPAPALVDADHCNGCMRCFADCPYAAITMAPHPSGRGQIAVVDDDRCASCGICAGACPSSTPFRSDERLVSGIDMPQAPVGALRDQLDAAFAGCDRADPIVVFACQRGAGLGPARRPGILSFGLSCAGMLPPSFVEYALRKGARGVMVAACPEDDCEFRFGVQWTAQRLAGAREPRLRAGVDREQVAFVHAAREERAVLEAKLADFSRRMDSAEGAVAGAPLTGVTENVDVEA